MKRQKIRILLTIGFTLSLLVGTGGAASAGLVPFLWNSLFGPWPGGSYGYSSYYRPVSYYGSGYYTGYSPSYSYGAMYGPSCSSCSTGYGASYAASSCSNGCSTGYCGNSVQYSPLNSCASSGSCGCGSSSCGSGGCYDNCPSGICGTSNYQIINEPARAGSPTQIDSPGDYNRVPSRRENEKTFDEPRENYDRLDRIRENERLRDDAGTDPADLLRRDPASRFETPMGIDDGLDPPSYRRPSSANPADRGLADPAANDAGLGGRRSGDDLLNPDSSDGLFDDMNERRKVPFPGDANPETNTETILDPKLDLEREAAKAADGDPAADTDSSDGTDQSAGPQEPDPQSSRQNNMRVIVTTLGLDHMTTRRQPIPHQRLMTRRLPTAAELPVSASHLKHRTERWISVPPPVGLERL